MPLLNGVTTILTAIGIGIVIGPIPYTLFNFRPIGRQHYLDYDGYNYTSTLEKSL